MLAAESPAGNEVKMVSSATRAWVAGAMCVIAAALTGCFHNDSGSSPSSGPSSPSGQPARGALVDNPPALTASFTPDALLALLAGNQLGQTFLQLAYTPKCSINVYHLTYDTVDPGGNITPASGALMIPNGSNSGCSGGLPVVLYAHGTTTDRNFDISQLNASDNDEGVLLAAVFAAEGYIVVAPNYLGYDTSTLGYHTYLIAAQQSKEMIDALTASRSALAAVGNGSSDDGKLFVTGYSEGGYVAMATQSAMQSAGMAVTAGAPMSGPYALAAFGDAIFEGQVSASATVNVALLVTGYQNAYGDLYTQAGGLYASPYDATVPTLLPSTSSLADLQSMGQFPSSLFDSTPPSASYAVYTPATSPASLASVFAAGFGTNFLVTNSYRGDYLADALANADGGFPTVTTGLPPTSPGNPLRQHLKSNDLRNWSPAVPTLLCGGSSDPTVFFLNTALMQNYWMSHPPAVAPVILDVDSAPTSADPYATLKNEFSVAKGAVSAAGGESAVLADYHATLVPPFCLTAVKSFFDGL
jgi:poly(3-hydroxybutyrate) depolymerase